MQELVDPKTRQTADEGAMTALAGGDLILVGAGGFGRETLQAVRAINAVGGRWRLAGFLDDNVSLSGRYVDGIPVLGGLAEVKHLPNASIVVCTGRPDDYPSRERIVDSLGLQAERYATIIHPTASVPTSIHVGPGTVLLAQVAVTAAVMLGSHIAVMPHVTLTHDNVVEDFATIASGVRLGGGAHVGRCAYMGAGALVRENRSIGPGALIGMGSVVLRDVPANEVWAGNPARFLRHSRLMTSSG